MSVLFNGRDTTDYKEIEKEFKAKFKTIVSNISDVIMILGDDKEVKLISPNIYKLFGWEPEEELKCAADWSKIHPDDRNFINEAYDNLCKNPGTTVTVEYRYLSKNDGYRDIEASATNLIRDETINGILINFRDVTAQKNKDRKVQFLSYHDPLTGLYNRAFFLEELNRIDREDILPVSIIMGDVNGLKLVNDVFGHLEGDRLLKEIAEILKQCCRNEDVLSRIGGDEFCILLPRTTGVNAQTICNRIFESCKQFNSSEKKLNLSISLGYATKTLVSESITDVLTIAEGYMYRHKLLESRSAHGALINSIKTTLYEKSHETEEHAERLVYLSKAIGKELDLKEEQLKELELAAMLHDIGKISVDQRILNKKCKLSREEWLEIKKHPEVGYRIALASPDLLHIANYILYHHERWDGKGYPQGLKEETIPLFSRIIAVADSYDAMTNDRPYRKAKTKDQAIIEIAKNTGTQFDPRVVDAFLKIING